MPAYKRVMRWVRNQPYELMLKRAKRKVMFNDLVHSPDKYRGKLITMELNVRRALKIEDLPADELYKDIYELWGPTPETMTWLYETVAVDLPKQMPVGPFVSAKVRMVGYFFKLQAYDPAEAKPNQRHLIAPMFIGRISYVPPEIPKVQAIDWVWASLMGGIFLIVIVIALVIAFIAGRRPAGRLAGSGTATTSAEEWLERAGTGDSEIPGNIFDDSDDSTMGDASGNGSTRSDRRPDDDPPEDR
jgi:hypothetical protein